MLIKALCDYYDILAAEGKLTPEEYSKLGVHYCVSLTPDGKIAGIIDWRDSESYTDKKGKQKERRIPRDIEVPKRSEKPGIESNIIEHRPIYIFGLNLDDDRLTPTDKTKKAEKSHVAFKEANLAFLEGLSSPIINAYRAFIENWVPENETENPWLLELGKNYKTSSFAFCLSGHPEILLHNDPLIKKKWEREYAAKKAVTGDEFFAQCAVTGERTPIARIHNKINGIYGGLPTGSVFIGYKNSAGRSYGNEQSYNSNISETAMKKYTAALNYLLGDLHHKNNIDDITVVYWATNDSDACSDIFSCLAFGDDRKIDRVQTENMLEELIKSARAGNIVFDRISDLKGIDENVDFYILGLKPNSSRVAVKFIYHRRFGEILQNIARHQSDMQVGEKLIPVSLWRLEKELISPNSKDAKIDPSLLAKIFEAIIYGTPYPHFMLSTLVMRAKTDKNVSYVRAGAIKACINRNLRLSNKKEELTMALNKENQDQAYLCGRLFATLEKLQQDAADTTLNRTIKDAYFASAASKPALVFVKLLKLSQNHLKKLERKSQKGYFYFKKLIGEIVDGIECKFPETLTLTEQGTFIVGYYQQYQDFFKKKSEDESDSNIDKENQEVK